MRTSHEKKIREPYVGPKANVGLVMPPLPLTASALQAARAQLAKQNGVINGPMITVSAASNGGYIPESGQFSDVVVAGDLFVAGQMSRYFWGNLYKDIALGYYYGYPGGYYAINNTVTSSPPVTYTIQLPEVTRADAGLRYDFVLAIAGGPNTAQIHTGTTMMSGCLSVDKTPVVVSPISTHRAIQWHPTNSKAGDWISFVTNGDCWYIQGGSSATAGNPAFAFV